MEAERFSLVTNASLFDDTRIRHTVPSWLRVFGCRLRELVIVVDRQPPSGRIATLHGAVPDGRALDDELDRLTRLDARVRVVSLPEPAALLPVARRWFRRGLPVRCQAGTPILAFVYAFEQATSPWVLRADCDMLFFEHGWLDEALSQLRSHGACVVEPGRPGAHKYEPITISTRALFVSPERLRETLLPMRAHKLDLLRRVHRRLHGRVSWLALEQMLERERAGGRLRHVLLPQKLGYSIHVATRAMTTGVGFAASVVAIESGALPAEQADSWEYLPDIWSTPARSN